MAKWVAECLGVYEASCAACKMVPTAIIIACVLGAFMNCKKSALVKVLEGHSAPAHRAVPST